jgi:segregation and condensation protein A
MMRDENLEVTGEFLVMAATLIQIKSKLLLPPDDSEDEDEEIEEEDPRLELVEKLLEYRRYKDVAERLERLEAARSDVFARRVPPTIEVEEEEEEVLEVSLYDLVDAFKAYLKFFEDETYHQIQAVQCSVDDKVEEIERRLVEAGSVCWTDLLADCRSRVELVCCFLAILELCRMGRIRAHQHANFDEIRIFPVEASAEA